MAMPQQGEVRADAAIPECTRRLVDLTEKFGITADRLRRVLDRGFGSSPGAENSVTPKAVPAGEIGAMREKLSDLEALASEHSALLSRIDTIV